MATAAARERYARRNEQSDLKRVFDFLDHDRNGLIHQEELRRALIKLGHKPKRGEVEDMLWEVDEDCDGWIDWGEFCTIYHRCREDIAGVEPRGLYNLIEFIIYDQELKGYITLEEVMKITYLRYGRQQLDQQLEEVFGTSDLTSGKKITVSEFLHCLHRNQVKTLLTKPTMTATGP